MEGIFTQTPTQETIPETIEKYAKQGIFIEVIADWFKIGDVCWRGIVHWKEDGDWKSDDMGCQDNWEKVFKSCVDFADNYILQIND